MLGELATTPGWWVVAAIAVAHILLELPRRRLTAHTALLVVNRAAITQLRRRMQVALSRREDERPRRMMRGIDALRARSVRARRTTVLGTLALTALWVGALVATWSSRLNENWVVFEDTSATAIAWSEVGLITGLVLMLAAAYGRDQAPAALERAMGYVAGLAVGFIAIGLVLEPTGSRGTIFTAVLVAVSPAVRRVLATITTRPWWPDVAEQVRALVDEIDPSRQMPTAPPPARVVWYPLIDAFPGADLVRGAALPGAPQHIRTARINGSGEELVLKSFDPGSMEADGRISRNPWRPANPYREIMSRINTLDPRNQQLAEWVMLWPRAVVTEQGRAVGVLYRRIDPPFLLAEGGSQTGDYLLAEEPEYSGSAVATPRQRGEILLDVLRAHVLLHRLGLAHGDTSWKNFVYGIDAGRGRAMLIDVDGVTTIDDPRPLLLDQEGWECPPTMRPVNRDVRRCAYLVCRLASATPDWERTSPPPPPRADWYSSDVDRLVRSALADHSSLPTVEPVALALSRALAGRG